MQNTYEGGVEASHHVKTSGNVSCCLTTVRKKKREEAWEAQLTNGHVQ